MIFSIPIYIEEQPGSPAMFAVRPLFHPRPAERAENLGRALNKLTNALQELLLQLGREPRHDALAEWAWHPALEETNVNLRLELASGSPVVRLFLAGYEALDRKLFFTPTLPGLQFEVFPGESIEERATAVYTRHFRDLEKAEAPFDPQVFALQGKARLTTIEISLDPAALAQKAAPSRRASLFGGEDKKDGERELRRTGRSLMALYPDDLERAVGREREVEELARLLAATDRRPILLVGPRKVGKTTLLHELAWQMCARKKEHFGGPRDIWLLSPMRLISGMSYLGEWENRVLAILDHAQEKDLVLYFDDLIGLFSAGQSSASDLNVAQVLRPALEKRRVRLIAEITPEAWRVLRERDRALADLFHILPVPEPAEPETLRILVRVTHQLEEQYGCEFSQEVVPTVLDLHRRFASDAAFPGKAAGFLRRLAVRRAPVGRDEVYREFSEQSGMQINFLDDRQPLDRAAILQRLRQDLAGQEQALATFADIILTLKARLNDPRRPLGVLLLLGPTGVGKTQSAKALARFLFGQADRLLRFDMNEYVDGAASRLAGTAREPEGLLTGAIRRQPFSVILLDEIEKAAPEVFDLLLAVLDEGRLADALGRVADFTNSVILLTSNLGAHEARAQLGFGAHDRPEAADARYVQAAEKFFRPEFFNRLDQLIPFRPLSREQLEQIAQQLIGSVFTRDGLLRRECLLQVSPQAMARLVELGQDPQLGARALKRVIEREVAQPIAQRLAVLPPGSPTIALIERQGDGLVLHVRELRPVNRSIHWPEQAARFDAKRCSDLLEAADAALDRIEAALESLAPTGRLELGNLPPESARYFACREQLKKVDRIVQAVERSRQAPKKPETTRGLKLKPLKLLVRQYVSGHPRLNRLRERAGLEVELSEWEAAASVEMTDSPVLALCRELALLEAMTRQPWDDRPAVLVFRPVDPKDRLEAIKLAQCYHDFINDIWGAAAAFVWAQPQPDEMLMRVIDNDLAPLQALFIKGFNLRQWLPPAHTLLTRYSNGNLGILTVHLLAAESPEQAETLAREFLPEVNATRQSTPGATGRVLQLLTPGQTLADFRTGMTISAQPAREEFRAFQLTTLPLPPEINLF